MALKNFHLRLLGNRADADAKVTSHKALEFLLFLQ